MLNGIMDGTRYNVNNGSRGGLGVYKLYAFDDTSVIRKTTLPPRIKTELFVIGASLWKDVFTRRRSVVNIRTVIGKLEIYLIIIIIIFLSCQSIIIIIIIIIVRRTSTYILRSRLYLTNAFGRISVIWFCSNRLRKHNNRYYRPVIGTRAQRSDTIINLSRL